MCDQQVMGMLNERHSYSSIENGSSNWLDERLKVLFNYFANRKLDNMGDSSLDLMQFSKFCDKILIQNLAVT